MTDRPGSNTPNPLLLIVAFGTQPECCPNTGWVVPSALLLCFGIMYYLASPSFGFWCWVQGYDDGNIWAPLCRRKQRERDRSCINAPTPVKKGNNNTKTRTVYAGVGWAGTICFLLALGHSPE